MRRISRKKALRNFRHMWKWLAEKTEKWDYPLGRSDYYDYMLIPECLKPDGIFFCCDYVNQNFKDNMKYDWREARYQCGDFCPINWGEGYPSGYVYADCGRVKYPSGEEQTGWFFRWGRVHEPKERAKLARIISELPERE